MISTERELLDFLDLQGLGYERIEHPAVFTCEEAERYRPNLPVTGTKNLFLCDKKARRFFLLVLPCEKSLNLKRLAVEFGVAKLRFASERSLERVLGVGRGAVTLLGLVNDVGNEVELWIDDSILRDEYYLFHPLVNTASLVLEREVVEKFLALSGHRMNVLNSND